MEYKSCCLYGLKSKKKLMELLYIERKAYCKAPFINTKITPYIENNKRLIEAPSEDLKAIQRIILKLLQKIIVPNNVFSGIKGKSFIDNAKLHKDKDFVFKVDISKFFPSIRRNRLILKTHNYLNERKSGNEANLPQLKGCIVVSKTINGKFKELHYQIKNTKSV